MGFIDFVLNLAGLLLWMNWLSVPFDPLSRPVAATLAGTLRRAAVSPRRRRLFGVSLAVLLLGRALFYWQIGAGVGWTPKLDLGAIRLSFPLSFRGDFLGLMLVYSLLSFLITLAGFYLWLFLLSFLGGRSGEENPFLRSARSQLGPLAQWPWPARLILPWAGAALLWLVLSPLLSWLQIVPQPVSWAHRLQQAALLGISAFLVWKYLIAGLLALHILNSYVYVGDSAFWNFVTLAARSLLRPLQPVPLQVNRVDFAPLVGIAIVLGAAFLAQEGRDLPLTPYRIPSLADVYRTLPL